MKTMQLWLYDQQRNLLTSLLCIHSLVTG